MVGVVLHRGSENLEEVLESSQRDYETVSFINLERVGRGIHRELRFVESFESV